MKVSYRILDEEVLRIIDDGVETFAVEGLGIVSKAEAEEYIYTKKFNEFHEKHKEWLDTWKK